MRVDHVKNYKPPARKDESGNKIVDLSFNVAPQPIEGNPKSLTRR